MFVCVMVERRSTGRVRVRSGRSVLHEEEGECREGWVVLGSVSITKLSIIIELNIQ